MAYSFQVTVDAHDPHTLADWWAQTLGWEVEPSDEDFIRRMVAEGQAPQSETTTHRGVLTWRTGAALLPPPGAPRVLFQLVPETKSVKNRLHLDVRVGAGHADGTGEDRDGADEVAQVVESLTERGATVLHEGRQGPHTWVTLTDPEGNEFCVSP